MLIVLLVAQHKDSSVSFVRHTQRQNVQVKVVLNGSQSCRLSYVFCVPGLCDELFLFLLIHSI
jgi:hypothetical protein